MSEPELLYDDREPDDVKLMFHQEGFKQAHLEHGDFVVGPFVIERKQIADFMASVMDGRLLSQSLTVRESGKYPIVIVEGWLDWKYHKNTDKSHDQTYGLMAGGLADIVAVVRTPIVPTKDKHHTLTFIKSLVGRVMDPIMEVEPPLVKLKRVSPYVAALAQVPGVGTAKAKQIAKKYSSFLVLGNLSYLQFVDEFGEKTGDELYKLVTGYDTPEVFKRLGLGKRARSLAAAFPSIVLGATITADQAKMFLDKNGMAKIGDLVR